MESPNTGLRVTATFARGREVEWWQWTYDEESKAYVNASDMKAYTPGHLLTLVALKQAEGWMLCLQVV